MSAADRAPVTRGRLSGLRVGIVGGSVAGLATARALAGHGAQVAVYERSVGDLLDRGAGIALDPKVVPAIGAIAGHPIVGRVIVGPSGRALWQRPMAKFMTAWAEVYRTLRAAVPDEAVHAGRLVTACAPAATGATLRFADGAEERFDLVVGADGLGSTVRAAVAPGFAPQYCGYVAIRGMVDARALPSSCGPLCEWADRPGFVNYLASHTHVTAYWIPGPRGMVLNWMWYRNVADADLESFLSDRTGHAHRWSLPPGAMPAARREQLLGEMRSLYPAELADAAAATPVLFEQAIYRGIPARFASGRAVLVGDAAHVAVPHIGAGVSLSVQDALALAAALAGGDTDAALSAWAASRHESTTRDLTVAAAIGRSLQLEAHDWERFSADDFERWWAGLVGDHHLYFEIVPPRRRDG